MKISISIPEDAITTVDKARERENVDRSKMIAKIIRDWSQRDAKPGAGRACSWCGRRS